MDSSLYLLSRGFGSPENKVRLLNEACSVGKLEVVRELVEVYKVVGEFNFEDLHTIHACTKPKIAMHYN